ncbi:MAG: hypothetical protein M1822_005978 [Bathelium mastoideum]|nr:MAG: hypothetical protein M1822_005978 [Bathelium mastoideum]
MASDPSNLIRNGQLPDPRGRCKEQLRESLGFHFLQCGHIVTALVIEKCAANCKTVERGGAAVHFNEEDVTHNKLVCPTCLDEDSISIAQEESRKFDFLKHSEHPLASKTLQCALSSLQKDIKGTRDKVFARNRRCRAIQLQGLIGQRILLDGERVVGSQREQFRDRRERASPDRRNRSRSPLRDDNIRDAENNQSRREPSSPRTSLPEQGQEVDPKGIERGLVAKFEELNVNPPTKNELVNKLLELKLEEEEATESEQGQLLSDYIRSAQQLSQQPTNETEDNFATTFREQVGGADESDFEPDSEEEQEIAQFAAKHYPTSAIPFGTRPILGNDAREEDEVDDDGAGADEKVYEQFSDDEEDDGSDTASEVAFSYMPPDPYEDEESQWVD